MSYLFILNAEPQAFCSIEPVLQRYSKWIGQLGKKQWVSIKSFRENNPKWPHWSTSPYFYGGGMRDRNGMDRVELSPENVADYFALAIRFDWALYSFFHTYHDNLVHLFVREKAPYKKVYDLLPAECIYEIYCGDIHEKIFKNFTFDDDQGGAFQNFLKHQLPCFVWRCFPSSEQLSLHDELAEEQEVIELAYQSLPKIIDEDLSTLYLLDDVKKMQTIFCQPYYDPIFDGIMSGDLDLDRFKSFLKERGRLDPIWKADLCTWTLGSMHGGGASEYHWFFRSQDGQILYNLWQEMATSNLDDTYPFARF